MAVAMEDEREFRRSVELLVEQGDADAQYKLGFGLIWEIRR